jgi:hypothetical protein
MENRFRHKDGSWRWLNWTLSTDKQRIYDGRNITREKEVAQSFRRNILRLFINSDLITLFRLILTASFPAERRSGADKGLQGKRNHRPALLHFRHA